MNDTELLNQLRQTTKGLLWLSESNYPIKVIYWENLGDITSEKVLQRTGHSSKTKVEVKELDKFFSRATEEEDWYNDEEMAECKRYQELVNLLKTHLTDIKVYRVGEVEIDVYILGRTESGSLASLSTMMVET